ncbi:MAG: response regulator [Campylobacterales bacterium]
MNLTEELKELTKDLTVLYVEDEDNTRMQVSQILELFFENVLVGENGEEALKIYKQNDVDLIMTDLTMPKLDGYHMIQEIKKLDSLQHIIVLTAHNSSENLMQTIDLQLDGFLLKPLKMDKLLNLLYKVANVIQLEKNK